MEIALIIIAYILNVFLNRWLNYIAYKKCGIIIPHAWFYSIIATFAFLIIIIFQHFDESNWFTGRDWNNK